MYSDFEIARQAQTVYPSIAGGFAPATFFTHQDALNYAALHLQSACGVATCPALSFDMKLEVVETWYMTQKTTKLL
jgi:hypothetical protein